jgi:hypothetical protein
VAVVGRVTVAVVHVVDVVAVRHGLVSAVRAVFMVVVARFVRPVAAAAALVPVAVVLAVCVTVMQVVGVVAVLHRRVTASGAVDVAVIFVGGAPSRVRHVRSLFVVLSVCTQSPARRQR